MAAIATARAVRQTSFAVLARRFLATAKPATPAAAAAPPLVDVEVDGKKVSVPPGTLVIVACEQAGVEIPRFCYHERLEIAGNCRMCLVEVEKTPKPVASCAMPVSAGMKIKTTTPMVRKAREGVMEFLLANHPLDCAVCDQAGECDLQDQAMVYGTDRSRFLEFSAGKRAVEDKNFGPLIKTSMNRCIHCTRCVRFANEVAGAEELGTTGRGEEMQISTYLEKILDSELSANIVDLCPVGALMSKPYEHRARPWELRHIESIDVHDAIGSNIRVDARGVEVMRILPRLNEDVNEEWISDKTRFACDGLKRQRVTSPMIRKGNLFVKATWEEAFHRIQEALSTVPGSQMTAIAGQLADAESIIALKDLFNRLGSSNLLYDGECTASSVGVDLRPNYLINCGIRGIEQADALLIVGSNPRHEAPLLNARIRKGYLHRGLDVGLVGKPVKLTCDYEHLGSSPADLVKLLSKENRDSPFAQVLATAKRPVVLVGADVTTHEDAPAIFAALAEMTTWTNIQKDDWNGLSVLQRSASKAAAMDLNFQPGVNSTIGKPGYNRVMYLLGADEVASKDVDQNSFVIYQGHHGDIGANYADVVLPGAAYTEKSATYVNMEGRVQRTRAAVNPPGNAREDWKIIRALSEVLGVPLPYDSLHQVRQRLEQVAPHFGTVGTVESSSFAGLGPRVILQTPPSVKPSAKTFTVPIRDFYQTDAISRSSPTMAKCSAAYTRVTARKAAVA